MLRICLASVLLVCAVSPALAQNGRNQVIASECQELETQARDDTANAGASHPRTSAARSKYAAPAGTPAGSRGGGGDDDTPLQVRVPKWHSFLPGMFR